MGEGRSDQEIGRTLHLEETTVRSHVHRILQRLGVESRARPLPMLTAAADPSLRSPIPKTARVQFTLAVSFHLRAV